MRLALIMVIVALGYGWALDLSVPDKVTGEVGSFISIPLQTSGDATVSVEPFTGLQVVGMPSVKDGKGLLNVLVLDSALAGARPLTIRVQNAVGDIAEARVLVDVQARAGLSVRAPPSSKVVRGDPVRTTVQITNTGNKADTFRLELVSTVGARIEPDALQLEPGETGEALLVLDTNDVGDDITFIRVVSGLNPALRETAVINTTILPFAGADTLDGPALGYRLEAGGVYEAEVVDYRVNARLNGDLSEFVEIGSDLTFANEINLEEDVRFEEVQLSGNLDVSGDNWSVGYRGLDSLQRLDGGYGPYSGFFSLLLGSGYNTGVVYDRDAVNVSLTHTTTDINTDALRAGYRFDVLPELSLTPSVGLTGAGLYRAEDYTLTSNLALDADFGNAALIGSGRVQVNYPFRDDPWRLDAALSKRVQVPVGVTGELSLTPEDLSSSVTVSEVLTEEVSLSQRLSYSGDPGFQRTNYRLSLGTVYDPLPLPLTLRGAVNASLLENTFGVGYTLGATYRFNGGVTFSASFADTNFVGSGTYLYGAGLVYSNEFLDLSAAYQHAEESDELLLGVGGEYDAFAGSLQASYDFFDDAYLLGAALSYSIDSRYSLIGGTTWNEEAVAFRVGANIVFGGGFATPDAVVDFFGGRVAGIVTGTVFHDLNRNGAKEADEPFLSDVSVRTGAFSSDVSQDGRFRLVLPPGAHTLTLGNLPADLGVRQDLSLVVEQDKAQEILIAAETVVGLTGVVVDDANRDGTLNDGEERIAYAKLVLLSASGARYNATADDTGSFFFQNLEPGAYTLRLDGDSLPDFFEVTTPPLDLELKPGPFPRVTLGATARLKEVKQTLNTESLSLFVTTRPNPPPPGASVEVSAEVRGNPEEVVVTLGETVVVLEPGEGASYRGYVRLPETAQGVLNLSVTARNANAEATQQALVIVDANAPLATLTLSSAFVDPAEPITLSAEFFTEVENPHLLIAGERYALDRLSTYKFEAVVAAPGTAESYEVELWAGETKYAGSRFRVDDSQ